MSKNCDGVCGDCKNARIAKGEHIFCIVTYRTKKVNDICPIHKFEAKEKKDGN